MDMHAMSNMGVLNAPSWNGPGVKLPLYMMRSTRGAASAFTLPALALRDTLTEQLLCREYASLKEPVLSELALHSDAGMAAIV